MESAKKTQIHSLNDMLTVQTGAVVSRTIINEKTGTITLFAFDEGEGLSEHSAPYDAYVQILDGVMDVTIGGEPFQLKTGEMIIMPANIPHALKASQPAKMLLVMIRS
ncbi:MAG: cupin [Anaerolineaceae bacterium]|nr:cupin [Anaerolineaceae bacterium]